MVIADSVNHSPIVPIVPDFECQSVAESKSRSNRIASVGIAVFGGFSVGLLAVSLPFVWPAFRRHVLPYIPATDSQVNNVLSLVKRCRPSTAIDLGSGDGRIVIECAKLGVKSYGVELNPWQVLTSLICGYAMRLSHPNIISRLVLYSRLRSRLLGVNRFTQFERKDLWKVNTCSYDNVIVFGVEEMMSSLESKIKSDCIENRKQLWIIACRFPFVNWEAIATVGTGIDTVWLYKYPNTTSA